MKDRNFDDLVEKFERNVYQSIKGTIRLSVLKRDLQMTLDNLSLQSSPRCLDSGAGSGRFAQQLVDQGCEVSLCDISAKSLHLAKQNLNVKPHQQSPSFLNVAIQDLPVEYNNQFDLILNHAVLEWTAHPQTIVQRLSQLLKPGGQLSLMFYNKDALVWRNLLFGHFRKVWNDDMANQGRGLTPQLPIVSDDVEQWLKNYGLRVLKRTGVRVLYDYLDDDVLARTPTDKLLQLELELSENPKYLYLGRYLHFICQKDID